QAGGDKGDKGKGGFGDKGDKGKGGFGDKGKKDGPFGKGKGGPPQPGVILTPFLQSQLNLTDDQRKEIDALQKEVDTRLDKILNADQRQLLREMREKGPGGPDFKGKGK